VDAELVEQRRRQALVDDVRAALDEDVLVACGRPGLVDGGRYSFGHEAEPGREPHLGGRFVGDDVVRRCGRLVLAVSVPDVVRAPPTSRASVLSARQDRFVDGAAGFLEHPRVDCLAADAEAVLLVQAACGDVPVQRH
jgi:hypothetical protein